MGRKAEARSRGSEKKRISMPLIVWLCVSFLLMFANVDFGLLSLLVGGFIFLIVFALKKDREISQRRKSKLKKEVPEQVNIPRSVSANNTGVSVEYVVPETFEKVNVKVAGVTYANGRRQRQTILREIHWKDKEYSGSVRVSLRPVEYEGKPTIEVWTNKEQIGSIPKEQTSFFVENWSRLVDCVGLKIYGGGTKKNGEPLSYGASFIARFRYDD